MRLPPLPLLLFMGLSATAFAGSPYLCEKKVKQRGKKELRKCQLVKERQAIKACIENQVKAQQAALKACQKGDPGRKFKSPLDQKREQWRKDREARRQKK